MAEQNYATKLLSQAAIGMKEVISTKQTELKQLEEQVEAKRQEIDTAIRNRSQLLAALNSGSEVANAA